MGFADGFYYGQGRFIVDTTGVAVGTDYKVKSMTDNTKSWTKAVTTQGVPLVFDVPCKDYYKICQMTEADGEPVEIGGIYKTVDYGQTQFINVLDKKSLAGIQGILDAHQETEYLTIGDEVNVTIDGVDEVYQIAAINLYESHEVIFVAKYVAGTVTESEADYKSRTATQNFLSELYVNMADKDKKYIKNRTLKYGYTGSNGDKYIYTVTQKIWIPATNEAAYGQGQVPLERDNGLKQFPLFSLEQNRIKTVKSGSASAWELTSSSYYQRIDYIAVNGGWAYGGSGSYSLVPCFRLTADV